MFRNLSTSVEQQVIVTLTFTRVFTNFRKNVLFVRTYSSSSPSPLRRDHSVHCRVNGCRTHFKTRLVPRAYDVEVGLADNNIMWRTVETVAVGGTTAAAAPCIYAVVARVYLHRTLSHIVCAPPRAVFILHTHR